MPPGTAVLLPHTDLDRSRGWLSYSGSLPHLDGDRPTTIGAMPTPPEIAVLLPYTDLGHSKVPLSCLGSLPRMDGDRPTTTYRVLIPPDTAVLLPHTGPGHGKVPLSCLGSWPRRDGDCPISSLFSLCTLCTKAVPSYRDPAPRKSGPRRQKAKQNLPLSDYLSIPLLILLHE